MYVLVVVDQREGTASRKTSGSDLLTLWSTTLDQGPVQYQLATYPLDIGDVWFCKSDRPFHVPEKWQFPPKLPKAPQEKEAPEETGDLFQLPQLETGDQLDMVVVPLPSVPTARITPVDVVAFPPRPHIVVERKALADLKASYGDGRYRDQKARLMNCDTDLVLLLVEQYQGSRVKDVSLKKRYLSTFTHTMFRDNIPVYHTPSLLDSFEFLHHLATEMATGKLEARSEEYRERTKYTDQIQMSRKANLTADRGLELQLATIPGVSAKMARAVTEKYPSMVDLCAAYQAVDSARDRHLLLADLTFRGPSGKDQRLASRSSKIYQYLIGHEEEVPKKPPRKKAAK